MALSLKKTTEAYDILKEYKGDNPFLIMIKNDVFAYKNLTLNDFHIEYILKNYNTKPIFLNKVIKISTWFGEQKQKDWNLEFVPEKLLITYVIGETDNTYNVYVRYRQSQEKTVMCFIPKKAVITPLFVEPFENKIIDFNKYNQMSPITLKSHQEQAIKFLTTRKKCILALEMGLGKSVSAIVASLEDNYKKVLIVCPASIKGTWERELKYYIPQEDITIVDGAKWKENRFTIINYDILDNFYEIPTEIVSRKKREVDDNAKITYISVEKEVVSNKTEIIKESMENSQLFMSNFDLIIIDEAHRLSNATSGRYKILSDLIKRSNPRGIYELTGTMITNNPKNLYNILKIIDAEITKDWQNYMINYCEGKQIFQKHERDKFSNYFLRKKGRTTWYDLSYEEKQELNEYLDKNCKKIWLTNGASNLEELKERIKHLYMREINTNVKGMVSKEVKTISYDLSVEDKLDYNNVWDEYVNTQLEKGNNNPLDNKTLIEGSILRQWAAMKMIPYTTELVKKHIENGEKVIIPCAFDKELYAFQEIFKEQCVIYNGKMNRKQKDEAEKQFMTNDDVKVFIGNIQASCVGLTLIAANIMVFNSVSWLPADNEQMSFRILRIGQQNNVTIYFQTFKETFTEHMFDVLVNKENIINSVIIDESKK